MSGGLLNGFPDSAFAQNVGLAALTGTVPGELYRVPLTAIRDQFIPAEPPELELSVIELDDGESALAVVLRKEILGAADLVDISDRGGWRAYRSQPTAIEA